MDGEEAELAVVSLGRRGLWFDAASHVQAFVEDILCGVGRKAMGPKSGKLPFIGEAKLYALIKEKREKGEEKRQ